MGRVAVLDKTTIDKIAAGEVVERPASVVKELTENAIDAGATMVTVELKEGGAGLIRITDNGSGFAQDDIQVAFLRHSTSKIRTVEDLLTAGSLGFRGEALSSISAVSQVELISKQKTSFVGNRYVIEGGEEKEFQEAGCPDGTTFLVRNLFYNVPARRKFLKSATTESGYCSELMQRLALCRPEIAFKFINSGKIMFQTAGNGNLKEAIYQLFGRDIASNLSEVSHFEKSANISVRGFIGKPVIARGNRNFENYFINGRYIRNNVISKAIEEAFRPYMMQHKYPFTVLHLSMDAAGLDVNVHPSKIEVRFSDAEGVYYEVYHAVKEALAGKNLIPEVSFGREEKRVPVKPAEPVRTPEQFETGRLKKTAELYSVLENRKEPHLMVREETAVYETKKPQKECNPAESSEKGFFEGKEAGKETGKETAKEEAKEAARETAKEEAKEVTRDTAEEEGKEVPVQMLLPGFLEQGKKEFRIVGQVFRTYWLVEMGDELFMIDQHAAHEKVLFEQTMKRIREKKALTQQISPPYIASLSLREEQVLKENTEVLRGLGFEFEPFGGHDYKVSGMPADLCGLTGGELFLQLLDELVDGKMQKNPELLLEKVASMSCKAAIKGNQNLSEPEAKALIKEMLTLDNPYHCPHGRPTTVSMTKQEIEKKFKRIV